MAAAMFRAGGYQAGQLNDLIVDLAVLFDPAVHGTVAEPALEGFDPQQRALLVSEANKSAWIVDPTMSAEELVRAAAEQAQTRQPELARITSLSVVATATPFSMASVPHAQTGVTERPAAVAGMFYPSQADELSRTVDDLFNGKNATKQPWRAAMVPRAGLKYSGKVAAAVLDRVEVPETVIVIGPKHTRFGVEWAVAPHEAWQLPGFTVASDIELAQQLADSIADLELDAGAHQREHAIEVELPLLAHVAPKSRVVGIAIGAGDLERCQQFAEGLAGVLKQRDERVLLVISTDMNHFASDAETRRLDEMALTALESMKPEEVFNTVRDNHISMCGVLPAVMVLDALNRIEPLTKCERVDYATTADTTGDKERVVGYAGMLFS
jgi:AmmeMemoRadiSam system protein B